MLIAKEANTSLPFRSEVEDIQAPSTTLGFESKPDLGWYHYGWLELVYHRDLGFSAGQPFPLWKIQ